MTEEDQNNDQDMFEEQLISKIKTYYQNNPEITSRSELDNFLQAIDLLEIWDSEEEKETVWNYISKYMNDSKINCDGAIKGIKDLLTQDEEKENPQETIYSRVSRLSNKNSEPTFVNQLTLNKNKQKAIEEYDFLDNDSLLQFKKIFVLSKINKDKNIITFKEIQKICKSYKFIKIDYNDVWKYLYFLSGNDIEKISYDENSKININKEIIKEVESLIDTKLINEDFDSDEFENNDSDDSHIEEDRDNENNENNDNIETYLNEGENALELVDKIMKKEMSLKDNSNILTEIKNKLKLFNDSMKETSLKILNGEENNSQEIDHIHSLINERIEQIEKFNFKLIKTNSVNINKIDQLRSKIEKMNSNTQIMDEDYKALLEKYNNNQQVDIDEETERLLDENMMLTQEKEMRDNQIEELLSEKKNLKKNYEDLRIQLEEVINEKNDIVKEYSELKLSHFNLKNEYESLVNNVVNKIEQKNREDEEKNKKAKKKEKKLLEKCVSDITESSYTGKISDYDEQIKELLKINGMTLSEAEKIAKKRAILKQMAYDKLINYILELDKSISSLNYEKNSWTNKMDELISKLNVTNTENKTLKQINSNLEADNENLKKKVENLSTDIKNNEIFRPSIAMNSQMRISRMSKLNTVGINQQKFGISGNTHKKKIIGTSKLKDKNINLQIGSQGQKTKFEEITKDLYGVKEDENEDEDEKNVVEENKKKNEVMSSSNENNINIMGDNKEKEKNLKIENDNKNNNINIQSSNNINLEINNTSNNNDKNNNFIINEVENINDINLVGITSSPFEINNTISLSETNTIISPSNANNNNPSSNNNFEINNSNLNINANSDKNNNTQQHTITTSFFEQKPSTIENNNTIITNNETLLTNSHQIDNIQKVSNNLETLSTKKNDNYNISNTLTDTDILQSNININDVLTTNNNKIDTINNDNENKSVYSERNTTVVNNEQASGVLEDIIFSGVQQEGFTVDNSFKKSIVSNQSDSSISISLSKTNTAKGHVIGKSMVESGLRKNLNDFSESNSSISINDNKNNNNKNIISHNYSQSSSGFNVINTLSKNQSKIELEELRNNNNDYYSLYQEDYVQKELIQQKDKCTEFNIYSDQIYLLTAKKHLSKRYLLLTPSNLYIIEPKEMIFTHVISKNKITSIVISNKNINIIVFQFDDGENLLIETLRRMDLLYYLKEFYRTNSKAIAFKYEDKFSLKIKNKLINLTVFDKIFTNLSNFDGAQKIGFLRKYKGKIITRIFTERLAVLTSIGLILFDDPTSPPEKLYPIIGSTIKKIEGNKYGRENCFEITLLSGAVKVFSAHKKRECDSWLQEFERIQKEFQDKMKKLDTVSKMEFMIDGEVKDNKDNQEKKGEK